MKLPTSAFKVFKVKIDYQLVPLNIHQSNPAEQTIRTFNNHFVAGLFTANIYFIFHLWDRLLYQATTTLNMMRKSIINPNIFYDKQIFGIFNFNWTPFPPPGTRILVRDNHENRLAYAPHGSYEWYIGRAPLHYICFKCYMTIIKSERTSDTVDLFPYHFTFPKPNHMMQHQLYNLNLSMPYKTQHRNHHPKLKNPYCLPSKTIINFQMCSTTTRYLTATAR